MNLLWLSHFVPYPPKGGALQRSYNLLRELGRTHHVHLLAFDERPSRSGAVDIELSRRELSQVCASVRIIEPPYDRSSIAHKAALLANVFSHAPYSVDLLRSATMRREIEKLVAIEKIDVLHVDAIELTPYADLVPARAKLLNHHNAESQLLSRRARLLGNPASRGYMNLQARKLARYEGLVLPKFDLNLAVSEEDRQVLLQRAPSARVEIVPNGVDTDYFQADFDHVNANELVYVGGLTWFPNRDAVTYLLSDVWPEIRKLIPTATCKLVGRVPADEPIGRLPQGVQSMGFVDDVRPYLASAAALVVPLRVGGGTRLKILDALACGKPVVSTSIGCEGLGLLPEKEILVADSPSNFAAQVARVCSDSDLRRELGHAGRERVEREYSWRIIGERYNRLLRA